MKKQDISHIFLEKATHRAGKDITPQRKNYHAFQCPAKITRTAGKTNTSSGKNNTFNPEEITRTARKIDTPFRIK